MSTLSELYITMESLRKLNLPIDEKLKQEAAKLEEDLIRQEILPTLTNNIEPALAQVQRELVLVVDYVPNEPLKVSLSRKRNITDVLTDVVEISPTRPHVVTAKNITRSEYIDFKVKFADGFTCVGNGKDTFIGALRYMGFSRVATFTGRTFAGFPLVGRKQRITEKPTKWQEKVDGWWIYINMSNTTKIDIIRQVAKFLGITIDIEMDGKPVDVEGKDKSYEKRAVFSLNGGTPMSKRASVLAVVRKYVSEHPEATFESIKNVFPDSLQGSYGVVKPVIEIQKKIDAGQDAANRYYLAPNKLLTSSDGVTFAVCHQWGNQFPYFQKHIANVFRWELAEV